MTPFIAYCTYIFLQLLSVNIVYNNPFNPNICGGLQHSCWLIFIQQVTLRSYKNETFVAQCFDAGERLAIHFVQIEIDALQFVQFIVQWKERNYQITDTALQIISVTFAECLTSIAVVFAHGIIMY